MPGNLGQVWLGVFPNQFFTVSAASIQIQNNLDTQVEGVRNDSAAGGRAGYPTVSVTLELFGQDDVATTALYQAARQQSPVGMMFQLGQVPGNSWASI